MRKMNTERLTKRQIRTLSESVLLKNMTSEETETLLNDEGCLFVQFSKGETVFSKNDTKRFLMYIVKGKVEVYTADSIYQMRKIDAGNFFGVASLFNEEGYVTDVIADSDVSVIMFEQQLVDIWIRNCPTFAANMITFLCQRVRFLNRRIALLTNDSSQHSLNGYLVGAYENWGPEFTLPQSCAALARTLNISRSALYRALADLETNNIIKRQGKKITVLNIDALKGENL